MRPLLWLTVGSLSLGCVPELRPATTAGTAGDTDTPTCEEDPARCDVARCDPLFQNCGPGLGCYPVGSGFDCAMPTDERRVGEACQLSVECLPGTLCAHGTSVPECDAVGCCAEYCDLDDAGSSCKLAAAGATCVPFYDEGQAPPDLAALGVCALAALSG